MHVLVPVVEDPLRGLREVVHVVPHAALAAKAPGVRVQGDAPLACGGEDVRGQKQAVNDIPSILLPDGP